jgi:hypothetical protein
VKLWSDQFTKFREGETAYMTFMFKKFTDMYIFFQLMVICDVIKIGTVTVKN